MSDKRDELIAKLEADNQNLGWRLTLAQAYAELLVKAYDALQAYGIDFRKLRTYPLWDRLVPEAVTYNSGAARNAIGSWIQQCTHDIDAAIRRRRDVHQVIDNKPEDMLP